MKTKCIIILVSIILFAACSGEKTDALLLQLDQAKLQENLNYDKIVFYKYAKIAIRAAAVQDTTLPAYQKFSGQTESIYKTIKTINPGSKEQISVMEALRLYRAYQQVKSLVKLTDEDDFPTLTDGIIAMRTGKVPVKHFYPDGGKTNYQNIEHAALSVAVLPPEI